jgi:D-alanine--poly(phosphoribitol) ligase subunit 1
MPNLGEVLLQSARRYPAQPALWVDGECYSYAHLAALACSLAVLLAKAPGGACAVFAERSLTAYRAAAASLLAGKTYVPLNPGFPPERTLDMLQRSGAETVVADRRSAGKLAQWLALTHQPLHVLLPDETDLPAWTEALPQHHFVAAGALPEAGAIPDTALARADIAYLLFTSGSTGRPKGVMVGHDSVLDYLRSMLACYPSLGPGDRCTQFFELTFDLSLHDLFVTWAAGACLYAIPRGEVMLPIEFVRQHRLTVWFSVPSLAAGLQRFGLLTPGALPCLRLTLFCGEALPAVLARAWLAAAPNSRLDNLYGPTEATIACTATRVVSQTGLPAVIAIGLPLPGQEAVVVDEHGQILPDGHTGELYLGGSQLALGYWRDEAQTAARFVERRWPGFDCTRWYRTGDLAQKDEAGELHYRGRLDRQLKIRGYRVELQEIETVLREESGCHMVAVIPLPADENGVVPGTLAFLGGSALAPARLKALCAQRLPAYMVPQRFYPLEALPLNANGKIDYAALARQHP